MHFQLVNKTGKKIRPEAQIALEEDIMESEVSMALKEMKNGKSPGLDGLTVSFYKCFWRILKKPCTEALLHGIQEELLHNMARRGVINLIPKAKKDSRKLIHLRPITLLCVDYKLLEKVLANRIKTVIRDVVHMDQKGFMSERKIATNIRSILDLVKITNEEDQEALLLQIDFEKCFDKISFEAIFGALDYFGFGDKFIKMVRTTYNQFTACIQNNGHFSQYFQINRSVHQGGPNSSFLFLLCAEMLAIMIREADIDGITVQGYKNLLNQYADDMNATTKAKKKNLEIIFAILEDFRRNSGFTVNYNKTTVYRLGSLKNSKAKCYTEKDLVWTNEPINVLGITIDHCIEKTKALNYDPLITTTERTLQAWARRSLSLFGKVEIINTLVASHYIHKFMVLSTPSEAHFKRIESIWNKFLWNGKPKISLDILQSNKSDGGAGLVNLRIRDASLKISWIPMLAKDKQMSNLAYKELDSDLGEQIWKANISESDTKEVFGTQFWSQVLQAWSKLAFEVRVQNPADQMIWYNTHLRIENKPFFWKNAYKRGLKNIGQLYRNKQIKSVKEINRSYGLTIMEYNAVVTAIPKDWRKAMAEMEKETDANTKYEWLMKQKRAASAVYGELNKQEKLLSKKCVTWERRLQTRVDDKTLTQACRDIYTITNVPKYRSFQYRLVQNALITNEKLFQWKIIDTPNCQFCDKEVETYLHLFVYCKNVQPFWVKVEEFMHTFNKDAIIFSEYNIFWNRFVKEPKTHIKNVICLLAKQYIYRQRCWKKQLNIKEFIAIVFKIKNYEKYYAIMNSKLSKHQRKWREFDQKHRTE